MLEPQIQTAEQRRFAFEKQLDNAKSPRWTEVPNWVCAKVSPLARFIATPELQNELMAAGEEFDITDPSVTVTKAEVEEYYDEACKIIGQQVEREAALEKKNPYHNVKHTRQVVDRVMKLILDTKPTLSAHQARAALVAAAFHDVEHPGVVQSPRSDISVEQYSARLGDIYARDHLNLRQRVEVQTATLGTSFWDQKLQPYTQMEKIVRLADLGGYMENPTEWINQSLDVAVEYAQQQNLPENVKAWLSAEDIFIAVHQWLSGQLHFIQHFLRPAHDQFKAQYISASVAWPPEESLQQKETVIAKLLVEPVSAEYHQYLEQIITTLERLRSEYALRTIDVS